MRRKNNQVLPTMEDFAPHGLEELKEDTSSATQGVTTRRGQQEMWQIGLKGQTARKAKWYERNQIASKFPHLSLEAFGDQKPPIGEV
jgi:hypothetical protein